MAAGRIKKQPDEILDYALDFSGRLETGETITLTSCMSVNLETGADSSAALISTSPAPAVSGQAVVFWLENGADGEHHKVTVIVTSSGGRDLEDDLDVFIVEE